LIRNMLSYETKKYLSSLQYDEKAEKICCVIPLKGIYWTDEIPDLGMLLQLSDTVRGEIYRLFRIRYAVWNGVELSSDDARFLEMARLIAPECPIFKRMVPADNDLQAQKDTREEMNDIWKMISDRSDRVEIKDNNDGTQTTSCRLKEEKIFKK
jgi:hypothetical protein